MIFRGRLRVQYPPFSDRGPSRGGPNENIAAAALDVIGWNGPFNLRQPTKMIVASKVMIDAAQRGSFPLVLPNRTKEQPGGGNFK